MSQPREGDLGGGYNKNWSTMSPYRSEIIIMRTGITNSITCTPLVCDFFILIGTSGHGWCVTVPIVLGLGWLAIKVCFHDLIFGRIEKVFTALFFSSQIPLSLINDMYKKAILSKIHISASALNFEEIKMATDQKILSSSCFTNSS